MGAATIMSLFFGRGKPSFSSTDVFPLTDAIMEFDDSSAEVAHRARRQSDASRLKGKHTNVQKWLIVMGLIGLFLLTAVVSTPWAWCEPAPCMCSWGASFSS